jgi:hypothetical protein
MAKLRYNSVLVLAGPLVACLSGQTQIDLRTQSRMVDFSKAQSTKPLKTVTALPPTCSVGEMILLNTAPVGRNVYVCLATNLWSVQNAGLALAATQPINGQALAWNESSAQWEPQTIAQQGAAAVESEGNPIGSRTVQNLIAGFGMTNALADTGSKINIEQSVNTALVQTRAMAQAGGSLLCGATGSSAQACSMSPALPAYTRGMVVHWVPAADSTGDPLTLDIDSLGAVPIKAADGLTDPPIRAVSAGRLYPLWFDGTGFRLPAQRYDKVSWGLCAGQDCAAGDTVAVPYIAIGRSRFSRCYIAAGTAPAGTDLLVDILKNGASIFNGIPKLTLAAGQVTGATATFSDNAVAEGDVLTAVITQAGSTVRGADVGASCRLEQ